MAPLTNILQELIDKISSDTVEIAEKSLPGGMHVHLRKDGGVMS